MRAMKGHSLEGLWTKEHGHAFLRLKIARTFEPILKGPKFDGTPFVITTDGCKFRFAGTLTQQQHDGFTQREGGLAPPSGCVCFEKNISTIEEHYQPYILDFATLKYSG
jgi:hypothetical protein